METVADFIFLGSKITADGNCNHAIKRGLLLGRKDITNLDRLVKKQRHQFANKVCIVKECFLHLYGPTEAEHQRTDAFGAGEDY